MSTTTRAVRWWLAALCLPLLLAAGCSDEPAEGDGDDAGSESASPSSSESESEPPDDEPTEPAVPDAMANEDKAGAKAFVEYYWDVVSYAQETGDTERLQELAFEFCDSCRQGMKGIEDVYGANGHMVGGEAKVRSQKVRVVRREDPKQFQSIAKLEFTEQQVLERRGGKRTTHKAARLTFNLVFGLDDDGEWRMSQWSVS